MPIDNHRAIWLQWTDNVNVKYLNTLKPRHDSFIRPEDQVLINRWDIMYKTDTWDMQELITRMYIKQLLRHPAFQLLLAVLLVINGITIALRTNSNFDQTHYELFSTIDDVVLTILICEVLLGWFNGFWIFWKDGWNILNFLIVFILLLGFFIEQLNTIAITYTLSPWPGSSVSYCSQCLAWQTSWPSSSSLCWPWSAVRAPLRSLWQVFSVFGVTLFGAFVPKHFQNMQVALYTLFICITQDGWLDIYSDFHQATPTMTRIKSCRWCTVPSPARRPLATSRSRWWGGPCQISRKTRVTTSAWCSRQSRRTCCNTRASATSSMRSWRRCAPFASTRSKKRSCYTGTCPGAKISRLAPRWTSARWLKNKT
ncbi:cation channel sperm-associated protein 4 isoform X5 [Ochotona princeps]|uniref:cation channel sperm-associated protein 4 isoform X5 n=1 Tax=Ochotona princeps TaxID=9978 RepID=UPI002714B1B1|nr:cation channel sperm-associated protein 4 isoform X5 [Ochotona princeps]